MKFKKQVFIESMVGLFSFAVIAALFLLTVVLSRDSLFHRSQSVVVVFQDVMGLRVGDMVSARGVTVGKVKAIELQAKGVHVHVLLDKPIHLREDYHISVMPTSVLGGRFLNIDEGTLDREPIPMPALLAGSSSEDLIDAATQTVVEIRDALNGGILEDLSASMEQIRSLATRLGEGEGLIGRLLTDDALYGDIAQILGNVRQVSDELARGEGTLGKLLTDEAVYEDVQAVAANLRQATDSVARGEGLLGRLLSGDDAMGEDLAGTLTAFRTISETIARGEGTLGRLLTDEELYVEFEALVREGRAAVEDFRETSPITTFTSIFFGVF
ncbi:MAG: MCE family protein [Lentisphaerae bacterium]|nr:MCE family protein [Lentisphaerota bacterium]